MSLGDLTSMLRGLPKSGGPKTLVRTHWPSDFRSPSAEEALSGSGYRRLTKTYDVRPHPAKGSGSAEPRLISIRSEGRGAMTFVPLQAEGFGRRYRRGRPWAVRHLDLAIPRGSITALVGPNGAGKSTLIRSWMGFERPDEGRVFVEGLDVVRNRTKAVEQLGYVPQSNALYRDLTVEDHFVLAASSRPRFDHELAGDRVANAGVSVDRNVGELSGGEQAQVALALALGTGAPILLLDEPLANLDPLARRDFLTALVDHVRSRSSTAILSSHIVTDVQQACDWLSVLSHGRLLLHASVSEARASHRTATTDSEAHDVVGRFIGPGGERLALLESSDPTLPEATLEEVVLGYMASHRSRRES